MEKTKLQFLILLIMRLFQNSKSVVIDKINTSFVFEEVGQITMGVSFGHLIQDVNMENILSLDKDLFHTMDSLEEHVNSVKIHPEILRRNKIRLGRARHTIVRSSKRIKKTALMFGITHSSSRQERSLLDLGFGIFNGIFSAYEEYQIVSLQSEMHKGEEERKLIINHIEELDKHYMENKILVDALKKGYSRLQNITAFLSLEMMVEGAIASWESMAIEYESTAIDLEAALLALTEHRLHPNLINLSTLGMALKNISETAKMRGLTRVDSNPTDIFEYDTSFRTNGTHVRVFVHVPLTSLDRFSLKKLLPVPTILGNNSLVMIHDAKGQYLAMDGRRIMGRVINDEDLRRCKRRNGNFICSAIHVMNTEQKDTCLGRAMAGDTEGALKICEVSLMRTDRPLLVEDSTTKSIVVLLKETIIQFDCWNGSTILKTVPKGVWMIYSRCRFSVDNSIFEPEIGFSLKEDALLEIPTLEPLEESIWSHLSMNEVTDVDEVFEKIGERNSTFHPLKDILNKYHASEKGYLFSWSIGNWVLLLCAILIGFLALWCFWKCCKKNGCNKNGCHARKIQQQQRQQQQTSDDKRRDNWTEDVTDPAFQK